MKALILVDLQNDFLPGGALPVKDGDSVIPLLNKLQQYFDTVVATQDWHPANHASFSSNHPGRKEFDEIYLHGVPQTLWPDHCVQGTRGAELSHLLDQHRIDAIIRKGMTPNVDSYSGFYDDDHRTATGLTGYLKNKGVGEVYITGLPGDTGVYYTAKDALAEGFKTFVIEDATRPLNRENFDEAMSVFTSAGGNTILSDAIIANHIPANS
ncbi:MAG: bifunctional nicotinamidase/pyrazinamidase [Bacteroidetes bacterium]|nr:bifunctional nicotinamidase/pyrazinamidase [Bacteroidota bacterium]